MRRMDLHSGRRDQTKSQASVLSSTLRLTRTMRAVRSDARRN